VNGLVQVGQNGIALIGVAALLFSFNRWIGLILMASMFLRELTLSVVLSRPGTEVLAVQILRFAEDGLWARLSALGIIMILISSTLAAPSLPGKSLTKREGTWDSIAPGRYRMQASPGIKYL
jgi:hypothetical protein